MESSMVIRRAIRLRTASLKIGQEAKAKATRPTTLTEANGSYTLNQTAAAPSKATTIRTIAKLSNGC
ncbi:hypothetical protein [Xanthobacter sp. VNH20]|uniref:hypothetical protein n=1 Tax=Xanthobacter sp. VNH20 TaxID=3156616 RepID=UPI0032B4643B